jgi:sugar lactone lactonase YvrE
VVAIAIAAAFCACGAGGNAPDGMPATAGGSSGMSSLGAPPAVSRNGAKSAKRVVFVSNLDGGIRIYSADIHEKNPPLLGTITSGASDPRGVWVDRKGTLYVVNASSGSQGPSLSEYKRGASGPFRTITNGLLDDPGAVAVGNDGTVYVNSVSNHANWFSARYETGPAGAVVVYGPGKTTPEETIPLPEQPEYDMSAGGMAIDKQGNVYVANVGNLAVVNVFKIAAGTSHATDLALTSAGGDAITMDGAGNLYAGGFAGGYSGYYISVYPPGATSPSRTISLAFQTYGITATSNGTLYVVAEDDVYEYAPGASEPKNTIETLDGETFTYAAAIGSQ